MRSLLGAIFDQGSIRFPVGGGGGAGGVGYSGNGASPDQLMRAYGSVSILFAIVDRLATATAKPEWHLMRKGTEVEVTDHPCIDLWNQPNPFYTQNDFIEAVQQHMDLVGEQWWIVARSKLGVGPPLELWPIRPDRMAPIKDPDTFISGYVYNTGTEKVPLGLTDVLWTKKQNPLDPYRGLGPVQSLLADLDAEKYSASWNANFFRNSALPGGIITVDGHLDDGQFEEMVLRWREQHQGVANAHRVAILEKATFQEMKYTQRDMQFQQLRQLNQEVIAMAYGFPLHMLGVSRDINRANAETQEVTFQRWLVVPRLERIRQLLNNKLLPMFGEGQNDIYEWVYDNPVPEDKKGDSEILVGAAAAAKTLLDAGFDPEEVLEACHLPPMKWTKPEVLPVSPGTEDTDPGNTGDKESNYLGSRRLFNAVREDSKAEMHKDWTKRLDHQQSALERFLDKRWT